MKNQMGRKIVILVFVAFFVITQCIPCGFSANQKILAAANANAIPTKKVSTAPALPAKTPQLPAKGGNRLNATTDFISQGTTLSAPTAVKNAPTKPAVSIPTTKAFLTGGPGDMRPVDSATLKPGISAPSKQTSSPKADPAAAALETKAATQTVIALADTTKVINDAQTALTVTNPQQKKENLQQVKEEVKTLETFVRLQVAPKTIRYGQDPLAVGSLSLPPGHSPSSAPAPVVILIHGGGFTGGSRESMNEQAAYLTKNGYAVLNIDYKLNDINGALKDTLAAIQWVSDNSGAYNLDANNISVAGFSAGATLATMVATQHPEKVNCAVAFSPGVDRSPATAPGTSPEIAKVSLTYTGPNAIDIISSNTAPTLIFTGGDYDYPGFGGPAVAFGQKLDQNGVDGGTVVINPPNSSSYQGGYIHGQAMTSATIWPVTAPQALSFLDSHQR
ncbi:MAG: alpha/beta hydrolase [Candidatus Omnitrophota bacterium]